MFIAENNNNQQNAHETMNEDNLQVVNIKTEPADEDETSNANTKCPKNIKLEDSFVEIAIKTEHDEETHSSVLPEQEPIAKNSECNNVVWIKSELNQHDDDTEKPFPDNSSKECEICKKSFKSRASLKIHFRTHTGEKPYICHFCGSSFTQGNNLKKHMLKHINDCQECKKAPDDPTKAPCPHIKDEVHKCVICNRGFSQVYHLKRHMVCHTGEKNHK